MCNQLFETVCNVASVVPRCFSTLFIAAYRSLWMVHCQCYCTNGSQMWAAERRIDCIKNRLHQEQTFVQYGTVMETIVEHQTMMEFSSPTKFTFFHVRLQCPSLAETSPAKQGKKALHYMVSFSPGWVSFLPGGVTSSPTSTSYPILQLALHRYQLLRSRGHILIV